MIRRNGTPAALLALLAVVGCSKETSSVEPVDSVEAPATPEAKPKPPTPGAPAAPVIDGVHLGDSYAELIRRAPYDKPCDDDPVDRQKTVRAMVYGGTECRGNRFADGTTLIVFIPFEDPDVFAKPIRTIAWLGGTYFDKRNNLGLVVGATREAVRAALGEPTSTLALPTRIPLAVEFYGGEVSAIYDGDLAAGYAIGPMPTEIREGDEHWRVVEQMYRRYTARVGSPESGVGGVTTGDCEKLLSKVIELMKADPKHAGSASELEGNRAEAIAQCSRKVTPAALRCGMAAKTYAEFRACER